MEFKKVVKSLPNLPGIYVYRAEFKHVDNKDKNTRDKDKLVLSRDIISDERLYAPKKRLIQNIVNNIGMYIKMLKLKFKDDRQPYDLIISCKDKVYYARLESDTGEVDKVGSNKIQQELNAL